MELGDKIAKELAKKYGYLPNQPKQLTSFVKTIHNFTHYLGSNKYYGDSLNKRIAMLSLDCDLLALRAERVRIAADGFYSQIELAMLSKKKGGLDKRKVEEFKKQLAEVLEESLALLDRALKLMSDIKSEYSSNPS